MVSLTCRPRMPPWALTSLAHSWYPFLNAWPSAEKSPVRDSDAPMVRGAVDRPVGAGVLDVVEFVQAARTLAPSMVPTARVTARAENREEAALMPSSSFRLRPGRIRGRRNRGVLTSAGYTGPDRALP